MKDDQQSFLRGFSNKRMYSDWNETLLLWMTDQTRSDVSPIIGGLAPSLRHTTPAVAPAFLNTINHGERNIKYVVTLMVVILVAIVWRRWSDLIFVKKIRKGSFWGKQITPKNTHFKHSVFVPSVSDCDDEYHKGGCDVVTLTFVLQSMVSTTRLVLPTQRKSWLPASFNMKS